MQLDYCPECGQKSIDTDPTVKEFLHEMAEEFLHWDGKLFATSRLLIAQPGELTREYLAGRRVRFISPLRVYLTCSVIFFFLNAVTPVRFVTDKYGHHVESAIVTVSPSREGELRDLEREAASSGFVKRIWLTHFARAMRNPSRVQRATSAGIPRIMFVLVPVFAALVGLIYRDRRKKYPQHLAYALHVHAALFLVLSVMLAGRFMPMAVSGWYQGVLALPFAYYFFRSLRTVYSGTAAQTVFRLVLISAMYFGAFLAAMAALFAIQILLS